MEDTFIRLRVFQHSAGGEKWTKEKQGVMRVELWSERMADGESIHLHGRYNFSVTLPINFPWSLVWVDFTFMYLESGTQPWENCNDEWSTTVLLCTTPVNPVVCTKWISNAEGFGDSGGGRLSLLRGCNPPFLPTLLFLLPQEFLQGKRYKFNFFILSHSAQISEDPPKV